MGFPRLERQTMSETTFKNISIGDRVWSCRYGYGVVMEVHDKTYQLYPLKVQNNTYVNLFYYSMDGSLPGEQGRDLYWDKFEIPKRPLKKVKKTVYIGINKTNYNTTDAYDNIKKLHEFMKVKKFTKEKNCEIITAYIEVEQ